MFKVRMEESGELNYFMPFLFMKPMEQPYIYDLVQTLMFPRVLYSKADDISDVNERNERIRMAHENKPWFQFHADLDTIRFYGKERIHNFMENLVMQMEVPYERLSPHPEEMDPETLGKGLADAHFRERTRLRSGSAEQ